MYMAWLCYPHTYTYDEDDEDYKVETKIEFEEH